GTAQARARQGGIAPFEGDVGPAQEGAGQPPVGGAAAAARVRQAGAVDVIQLVEESDLLVEVGRAGSEAVGLAGRVPADGDSRPGEPGDAAAAGDAEPVV